MHSDHDQHKTDINDLIAELCDDKLDEGFNRSKKRYIIS